MWRGQDASLRMQSTEGLGFRVLVLGSDPIIITYSSGNIGGNIGLLYRETGK